MPSWDPDLYERFKAYRDRPALDLLLQVPPDLEPREIWDLGCGTGEHAAVLAARHPAARVHGLDSSPDMLRRARARAAEVDWVQADIADFAPETSPDLIFSNAALQWTTDHATLFPRLASSLAEEGVLACQMPVAHSSDWHRALRELAAVPVWAERLGGVSWSSSRLQRPTDTYDWLSPLCGEVDIWITTYLHVLEGDDPVVDWMRGTALRPYLDALTDPVGRAKPLLVDAYRGRVRRRLAAPRGRDERPAAPFPRLFILRAAEAT